VSATQLAVVEAHRAVIQRGRFDAAIIDLDGTLVDTLGDFAEALNRMTQALPGLSVQELEVSMCTIEPMVGKGSEHLVACVLAHLLKADLNDPRVAALHPAALAAYQNHYREINGRFSALYPGVLPGLGALQASGLQLACLTNKPVAFALDLLQAKGLGGFFSHVFGGDSFERKKPDPLPLLKTCEALGSLPARTLMVGDSSNDAAASRAASCPVVLVTYGYNHGQPIRLVDADGYVDSLEELASLLA
jgi:phosphoglycolate phosphatase